ILADTVEALIGATFVSLGREAAFAFVHRLIDGMLEDAVSLGAGMDFKTTLQEAAADLELGAVSYEITSSRLGHARVLTVSARLGEHSWGSRDVSSMKAAEAAGAEVVVRAIRSIYPDDRR